MANYIWQKLQTALEEDIDYTNLMPFGFDVLRGDWKLNGANEAIRFNKYNCKKNEFFSVHRDSQFCPSGDERSVFSIVIYLNNGYSGGETVFYFPKDSSIESKGLDISEEIVKNLKYRNPVYLQLNSSNYYNLLQKIPFFYLMSILHPV